MSTRVCSQILKGSEGLTRVNFAFHQRKLFFDEIRCTDREICCMTSDQDIVYLGKFYTPFQNV